MIPIDDLKLLAIASPCRAIRIMGIALLDERSGGELLPRLERRIYGNREDL